MIIHIFCNFHYYRKRRLPVVIFQLNVVHNLPTKLSQNSSDEKLLLFLVQGCLKSSKGVFILVIKSQDKQISRSKAMTKRKPESI